MITCSVIEVRDLPHSDGRTRVVSVIDQANGREGSAFLTSARARELLGEGLTPDVIEIDSALVTWK